MCTHDAERQVCIPKTKTGTGPEPGLYIILVYKGKYSLCLSIWCLKTYKIYSSMSLKKERKDQSRGVRVCVPVSWRPEVTPSLFANCCPLYFWDRVWTSENWWTWLDWLPSALHGCMEPPATSLFTPTKPRLGVHTATLSFVYRCSGPQACTAGTAQGEVSTP